MPVFVGKGVSRRGILPSIQEGSEPQFTSVYAYPYLHTTPKRERQVLNRHFRHEIDLAELLTKIAIGIFLNRKCTAAFEKHDLIFSLMGKYQK